MESPLFRFLDRFRRIGVDHTERKQLFIQSAGAAGVALKEEEISLKGAEATILATASKRNEIFIKKERILQAFNAKAALPITSIH